MDHMSGCIKNSKTISRRREHKMSIVIIGGHDRMVRQYETICKKHNCKAKIFTQMPSCLNKKIGNPDLVVLFTNTVSHKMVRCAVSEAKNKNIEVVRSHSSSQAALTEILVHRWQSYLPLQWMNNELSSYYVLFDLLL